MNPYLDDGSGDVNDVRPGWHRNPQTGEWEPDDPGDMVAGPEPTQENSGPTIGGVPDVIDGPPNGPGPQNAPLPGPGPDPNFTIGHLLGLPDVPNIPGAPAPELPTWQKPDPFSYQDWQAPSVADAMADPSYKFRVNQGGDALQRWAAAKGTLNDTGTAKALIDYGQNAASQEYSNVWNRDFSAYNTGRQNALSTYNTNYHTQYEDPYKANYQRGMDLWEPQMETWRANNANNTLGYTTTANWNQHANDLLYGDLWNRRNGYLDWAKG